MPCGLVRGRLRRYYEFKLQDSSRTPEMMVDADRGHVVRGRETIEDLMRGEQAGPEWLVGCSKRYGLGD